MTPRNQHRRAWLENLFGTDKIEIQAASDDASFRSYYRLRCADALRNGTRKRASYILMDAPPERENCQPFIAISQRLCTAGLNVPEIIAADLEQGFLLLSDLGVQDYLQGFEEHRADKHYVDRLYTDAIAALVQMQSGVDGADLAPYCSRVLNAEMQLFPDWFLGQHLQLKANAALATALENSFAFLTQACLEQPQVFVHRDYHSRNLMQCPGANPGILDFQDALHGPISYDLVSVLRDVYIGWPQRRISGWIDDYYERACAVGLLAGGDRPRLQRWFDLSGIQRHLKVAGIFARLYYRDHKSRYLADLPLTLEYLLNVAERYQELSELAQILGKMDIINASKRATSNALQARI